MSNLIIPSNSVAISKKNIKSFCDSILQHPDHNDLEKYIYFKALETAAKQVIDDKEFRKKVKKEYLNQSGGALDKINLCGVSIKTTNQQNKQALEKIYQYSDIVDGLEVEVTNLEAELEFKKDALKRQKLYEINNGTAKEVTVDEILGEKSEEQIEDELLNSFGLTISFPNG